MIAVKDLRIFGGCNSAITVRHFLLYDRVYDQGPFAYGQENGLNKIAGGFRKVFKRSPSECNGDL
jgi:hypothetical protein